MGKLSFEAQELMKFLQNKYDMNGYIDSGAQSIEALLGMSKGFSKNVIGEVVAAGFAQMSGSADGMLELTAQERQKLLSRCALASVWFEKEGMDDEYLLNIQEEVQSAAGIVEQAGGIAVPVMKNSDDKETPDRIVVECPFRVGQVIEMEYDLPRNPHFVGVRPTEAVGQFMVTDIVRNQLVYPRENMIELQSLCDAFNKVYPAERTMQVFEDVVLKKMRNVDRLIADAAGRGENVGSIGYVSERTFD